jgi:tetratricopeptide (TPR) repeat protein
MKRSMIGYILRLNLCFWILCNVLNTVQAQSPEQLYSYAINQSSVGNLDAAIKAFHRIQYFDDKDMFSDAYVQLANCYYLKTDYDQAYYYYDLASNQATNDTVIAELNARKISCRLYNGDYQEALIDLFSVNSSPSDFYSWQFNMLYGMTYFYLGDYKKSEDYFAMCAKPDDQNTLQILDHKYKDIEHLNKRYNPKTAKVLSILVPGSGQIFSGEWKSGVNSLLLLAGLFYVGVILSEQISVLDAAIVVLPWFQRYYAGGFRKASEIALERREREKNEILISILQLFKWNTQ